MCFIAVIHRSLTKIYMFGMILLLEGYSMIITPNGFYTALYMAAIFNLPPTIILNTQLREFNTKSYREHVLHKNKMVCFIYLLNAKQLSLS